MQRETALSVNSGGKVGRLQVGRVSWVVRMRTILRGPATSSSERGFHHALGT